MLRLIAIGALGNMLSPSAVHLKGKESPAHFIGILDRGGQEEHQKERRQAWVEHGAILAPNISSLLNDTNFDGIVICAGKNGDDYKIIAELLQLIDEKFKGKPRPFILHCSTVSVDFVSKAWEACNQFDVRYANYPLTGGASGAQKGTMLILGGGDKELFDVLEPTLNCLGQPNYLGEDVTAGTKVKLIGHLLVFNGLLGISSAVTLHTKCFPNSANDQTRFFDFLNQGAGGTRQWDVTIRQAIEHKIWDKGFLLQHAVIDAIYTADLLRQMSMPMAAIQAILNVASIFAFLLQQNSQKRATQTILHALSETRKLDEHMYHLLSETPKTYLENIINALPRDLQKKIKLNVNVDDFLL